MNSPIARAGILVLAFCLAPDALAQATPEQKAYAEQQRQKREAAERKSQETQQRQRDNVERQRKQEDPRQDEVRRSNLERDQARQREVEERDRDRMDQQRRAQAERERQERIDAQRQQEWSRARDAINQDRSGSNIGKPQSLTAPVAPPPPARTGPYSIPSNLGTVQPSYTTPAGKEPSKYSTATSAVCSARPVCRPRGESRNVCRSVQQTYNATGAVQIGMQDIVQKCRSANLPDPCGFAEGCAAQCPQVAHCAETNRR